MNVIVAGDFCDMFRVTELIRDKEYSKMFGNIKDIVSNADFSFVNFEFPIVAYAGKPIPKCGPNLKGQPESVDAIKYAGFNCCTLANNHILDQGEECLLETKNRIERAGLKTVGAGANIFGASEILYLHKGDKILAVINACEHEFSIATETTPGANPLNPIQQFYKIHEARQKADYVMVIVHGGHEHYQLPSPRMKEIYRFFVDVGADAVVNHHQHCYSGYEVYKGKPIFYGIGNFLFDSKSERNSNWNEGYVVELFFCKTISFNLIPYTQCTKEATIALMTDTKLIDFNNRISKLNEIIHDSNKLVTFYKELIVSKSRVQRLVFSPYSNRYLRALAYRGWIPTFMGQKKLLELINYISCESHRDISLSMLSQLSKYKI